MSFLRPIQRDNNEESERPLITWIPRTRYASRRGRCFALWGYSPSGECSGTSGRLAKLLLTSSFAN
jgi:hypothetical protein